MSSTTLFTIGTALSRACDHSVGVRVLVSGHWIEGRVAELDGEGVVLAGEGEHHSVVRMCDISAVQVEGALGETPSARDTGTGQRVFHVAAG